MYADRVKNSPTKRSCTQKEVATEERLTEKEKEREWKETAKRNPNAGARARGDFRAIHLLEFAGVRPRPSWPLSSVVLFFSSMRAVACRSSILIARREEERVERERCSPVRRIWDRSGELEDDSRLKSGESKGRGLREKSGTKRNEEETGE